MASLHVNLLGDFRLARDGIVLASVNTPRAQALLAYLLLHQGTPQPRRYIAYLFWPDSTEAQARTNLRNVFLTLRRALPASEAFLDADAQTLTWRSDAPSHCDLADFERLIAQAAADTGDLPAERAALEQAVALYQGDLLTSCYDDWIVPVRERLRQQFIASLQRLTGLLEQQHDWRAAMRYGQRLLRQEPLHEETYQTLMRISAGSGDRVGVVRTYRACAAALAHELAVEPSRLTEQVYAESLQAVAQPPSAVGLTAQLETVPPSHNVPYPASSFIGRVRELETVKQLLSHARLVTLSGPGGCGKTRLAMALAHELADERIFTGGVRWVELAALSDSNAIPATLASALGIREESGRPLVDTLCATLRDRELLLVLDNCEHLVQACAQLTQRLLLAAPSLSVLATSREPLKVMGETAWPVPALSLEPPFSENENRGLRTSDKGRSEAVALFVERAQAALPTFRLTPHNASVIAHICRQLDAMPLAIELAAVRVRTLSLEQIAARLDDRFRLLCGGNRAALPRQQSLRATVAWSHDLPSEAERLLFRRLAVFAGGWSLAAAEQVTAERELATGGPLRSTGSSRLAPDVVFDFLSQLVDKSMVVVEEHERGPRFKFLETIRHFAREQLHITGESEHIAEQHAYYFVQLAESAHALMAGPEQLDALYRLRQDYANLRAAMDWALARQDTDTSLRLAGALASFWRANGEYAEGSERLRRALSLSWSAAHRFVRARALNAAVLLMGRAGHLAEARAYGEEGLALERELGDPVRTASMLSNLAGVIGAQGDEQTARQLNEENLAMRRTLGDKHGIAMSLNNIAESDRLHGRLAQALRAYEEALTLYREIGNRGGEALVLHNVAQVMLSQAELRQAARLLRESLCLYEAIHDPEAIAMCLAGFAALAVEEEEPYLAARLFGAVEATYERIGARMDPADRKAMERSVERLRLMLDDVALRQAWADGRAWQLAEAIQNAYTLAMS